MEHDLEIGGYQLFECPDVRFIPLVESPLLDPLCAQESSLCEDLQMFARRRLAHAKLLGDEQPADTILHEIPVHLGTEVRHRVLQPVENLQTPFIR